MADEKQTQTIKGVVNTHEKSTPEFKHYPSGSTRLTFNLVHRKGAETKYLDIVAYNQQAERLYSLIKGSDVREFTLTGEIKQNGKYEHLKVDKIIAHQLLSIEGEIKFMEDKKLGGKDFKKLLVTFKNEHNVNEAYNVLISEKQELNGAKLEVGTKIAVNGLTNEFVHKDETRSVQIDSWNVAKDMATLETVIESKKTAKKAQEPEMAR